MLEIKDATSFIENFEKTIERKVYRFPFTISNGQEVAILMCKCGKDYISLPYLSQGVIETSPKKFDFNSLPKHWEIRDTQPHSQFVYTDKVNFELNLLENYNYSSDVRRKIRKAERNGIKICHQTSEKLIKDFYYVYSKRMHKIGIPVVYKKYIRKKLATNRTILFVAYKDNKPIGVAALDKITDNYFENVYFSTLCDYNHFYTSYALHSAVIDYCKANNATTYSFGRSTKESSVYKYKQHWKVEEKQFYWSHNTKFKSIRNNKWFFPLWKRLPYPLTLLLGGLITRRVF